jgi:glycosyltransferase involved in cell wall biosynthesis
MAGLPILATQQPEYRRIVEPYGVGVCVNPDEPNAYLDGYRRIMASYATFRERVRRAREELNWTSDERVLLHLYGELRESLARSGP